MDGLPQIISNLEREHPDTLAAIRRLMTQAKQHPEIAHDIEAFFLFTLQQFDARGQLVWTLRDMVEARDKRDAKGQPAQYYALKHNASDLVRRIVAAAGLDPALMPFPLKDQPAE